MLTILYNIWLADTASWDAEFCAINEEWLGLVCQLFSQCNNGTMTLESMRDDLQRKYHDHNPQNMRFGGFTTVGNVLDPLFEHINPVRTSMVVCSNATCNYEQCDNAWNTYNCVLEATPVTSVREWVVMEYRECDNHCCSQCGSPLLRKYTWLTLPSLLTFNIGRYQTTLEEFDRSFILKDRLQIERTYYLRGLIYFSHNHFTARMFIADHCWLYNGASAGRRMVPEAHFNWSEHAVVAAIYSW